MKNLLTRSISGIVYVALIVGAIFGGPVCFAILMSLFAVLAVNEFENIVCGKPDTAIAWVTRIVDMLTALLLVNITTMFTNFTAVAFCYIVLIPLPRLILALYDKKSGLKSVMAGVFAIFYVAVPLWLLNWMYFGLSSTAGKPIEFVLVMFAMIWLNDTGAYCIGCTFGKHRLFERLSPKKSWEGFFGGLFFCVAAAVACHFLLPDLAFGLYGWIIYGVLVSVFGTFGDLFESLIKRTYGIKDSSHLIPGHGGILDRIDSLLLVMPAAFIFLIIYFTLTHDFPFPF